MPPPAPTAGSARRTLHAEPLGLARHVVVLELDERAVLDPVDRRRGAGAVIGRRIGDVAAEPAQVEIPERLERALDPLAVQLAGLVGALQALDEHRGRG